MKTFFLISISAFVMSTSLEAFEMCSVNFQKEKILDALSSDIKAIECEEINKKNICAKEKKIIPNLRVKLSAGLTQIDDAYQKEGKLLLSKKTANFHTDLRNQLGEETLIASLTAIKLIQPHNRKTLDTNYENYSKFRTGEKVELLSHYHDFLKTSGNEKNFSKFKEQFVDDYMAFNEEKYCQKGVRVERVSQYFTISREVEKAVGLKDCTQDKRLYEKKYYESKDKFTEYFENKYLGEKGLKQGFSCSDKVSIKPFTLASQESPSCAGRFEKHFADNEWEVNEEGLKSDEGYQKFKNCVENMQKKGFKLSGVTIDSSASQLNNTGKAKENFCQKGFLGLSTARANSAKTFLNKNFSFPDEMITINALGANKNGSSGECPYEIKDGKEVLKASYAPGGKDRKDLDKAKYVRVTANFEPLKKAVTGGKTCYNAVIICSRLSYKCAEWSQADTYWSVTRARKKNAIKE